MIFDENISEKDYYAFFFLYDYAHFLNAYWWGICNGKKRKQIPKYVGLRDNNNNILCETLLLKRDTPFNMCYYYAPRGFIIDWNNHELVKLFTAELKKFLNKTNAIYLKLDPAIIYEDINEEGYPINNGNNNFELFNFIISLGYIHKGFNKLYEGNLPRYTFRAYFKDYNSFEDIESNISKTFMRSIKR